MHGQNPVHSEGKISMTKKAVESCFIDTNILVYASDANSPWCRKANQALKNAISGGYPLFISPQVLREYLSVATRSVTHEKTIPWNKIVKNYLRFQRAFKVFYRKILLQRKS